MAAQIYYRFIVNGDQYSLIGITGGDLMPPEHPGMERDDVQANSHRGYFALYELTPEALYLRGLVFREGHENHRMAGAADLSKDFFHAEYKGPSMLIPFTGKLRLARDFIDKPYVNMGYQKAMAFKTVFDITLKNGMLVEVKDRSSEMEQKRGAFKDYYDSLNKLEKTLYAFNLDVELE